jgi:hypothetical protein
MNLLKSIVVFSFLFLFQTANAQNYIYSGNTKYKSTSTWEFALKTAYWTNNNIEVTIGKTPTGGCLLLSIEVPFKEYIGGTVTLYLSDGSQIKCGDKKKRSRLNKRSLNLYSFTNSEMERLKLNSIETIVFVIMSEFQGAEYYSAENNQSRFYKTESYDTVSEIVDLFE